jgi:hypothetical protein
MSGRIHKRPLTPYHLPLASTQKPPLTDPSAPLAKRVKAAVRPALKQLPAVAAATEGYAPPRPPRIQSTPPLPGALRKPPIENSIPCSPSAEFRMALAFFKDAEYGSSQETRVVNAEAGCAAFEHIATSKSRFSQEAEYLQALCQMKLALNMDDPFVQTDKLILATDLFQEIPPQHPRYWDAQYWLGDCLLRLGKLESIPKNKLIKFTQAIAKLDRVRQAKTHFAEDAQRLFQDCMQELNRLPKNASITFYGAKH